MPSFGGAEATRPPYFDLCEQFWSLLVVVVVVVVSQSLSSQSVTHLLSVVSL